MCSSLSWVNRGGCAEVINSLPIVTAGRPPEPSVRDLWARDVNVCRGSHAHRDGETALAELCQTQTPAKIWRDGERYVEGRECMYLTTSDFSEGGKPQPALQHRSAWPSLPAKPRSSPVSHLTTPRLPIHSASLLEVVKYNPVQPETQVSLQELFTFRQMV